MVFPSISSPCFSSITFGFELHLTLLLVIVQDKTDLILISSWHYNWFFWLLLPWHRNRSWLLRLRKHFLTSQSHRCDSEFVSSLLPSFLQIPEKLNYVKRTTELQCRCLLTYLYGEQWRGTYSWYGIKKRLTSPMLNSMLLWPEHSQTSPKRTSFSLAVPSLPLTVMVWGALGDTRVQV